MPSSIAAALLLALGQVAQVAPASPAQQKPKPPAAKPSVPAPAQPVPGRDDFDLLPAEAKPDEAEAARARELERKLEERRTLLRIHQVTGLTLLGAMGAATVLGQLDYSDKYGGGGDTGKWLVAHRVSAYGTAVIFTGAGLLALFAPAPFERPRRLDSATLHKTCMAVATAGMVAQVVLGIATAHSEGKVEQRDLALAHQIIGYTTMAATTAGFVMLTF